MSDDFKDAMGYAVKGIDKHYTSLPSNPKAELDKMLKYMEEAKKEASRMHEKQSNNFEKRISETRRHVAKAQNDLEVLEQLSKTLNPSLMEGDFAFHPKVGNCIIRDIYISTDMSIAMPFPSVDTNEEEKPILVASVLTRTGNHNVPYSELIIPTEATKVLYGKTK